jgi:hypothetical protein
VKRTIVAGLIAGALSLSWAQESAPIASQPKVQLKGTVSKVNSAPAMGMPSIEVQTAQGVTKVVLGSMRYLLQNEFNPKAGAAVEVKGYQMGDQVVAIEVALPSDKKVLKLRDENGWPVWMQGRNGQRGNRWQKGKQ